MFTYGHPFYIVELDITQRNKLPLTDIELLILALCKNDSLTNQELLGAVPGQEDFKGHLIDELISNSYLLKVDEKFKTSDKGINLLNEAEKNEEKKRSSIVFYDPVNKIILHSSIFNEQRPSHNIINFKNVPKRSELYADISEYLFDTTTEEKDLNEDIFNQIVTSFSVKETKIKTTHVPVTIHVNKETNKIEFYLGEHNFTSYFIPILALENYGQLDIPQDLKAEFDDLTYYHESHGPKTSKEINQTEIKVEEVINAPEIDILPYIDFNRFNKVDKNISRLGKVAVKLTQIDPNSTIFKTRQLAEYVVKKVFDDNNIEATKTLTFVDLIQDLKTNEIIDRDQEITLNEIRKIGNIAAHESTDDRANDYYASLELISKVYDLCVDLIPLDN